MYEKYIQEELTNAIQAYLRRIADLEARVAELEEKQRWNFDMAGAMDVSGPFLAVQKGWHFYDGPPDYDGSPNPMEVFVKPSIVEVWQVNDPSGEHFLSADGNAFSSIDFENIEIGDNHNEEKGAWDEAGYPGGPLRLLCWRMYPPLPERPERKNEYRYMPEGE
jgi:hypothetical protein